MCLAQGPQRSDAGEARTRGPSVSSQALYHWATALPIIIVSGLNIKPVLPYRQNLKKVQTSPPPKLSQHIHPGKGNAVGPQQHTKDKRLPSMLTYKVGHPCRLRLSWLHE